MTIDWMLRAVPQSKQLFPYVPGKPLDVLLAEQGITEAIKLASNENPFGSPPKAVAAIGKQAQGLARYPDGDAQQLKQRLAKKHGVTPAHILVGSGSSEVLELVIRTFAGSGDEVVYSARGFIMYPLYARAAGAVAVAVPENDGLSHDLEGMAAAVSDKTKVLCIANPNNPTGSVHAYSAIQKLLDRIPSNVVVLLDEAYYEFMDDSLRDCSLTHPGLIICRTFSKAYGLAGCRIGYGVADPDIFGVVNRFRPPFNTGLLSQYAAIAALEDDAWVRQAAERTISERGRLETFLAEKGLLAGESAGNFVLIRHAQSDWLLRELEQRGIIPRPLQPYGMGDYLRITVGTPTENDKLIVAMTEILAKEP